ncbi:MAG: BNR-4 repeat-containing protein, partial [Bacteroidaceae bacterium]|nr:BNR-4 repeat-containing protein [Bacteroidaceae bacterium]
MVNFRYLLFAVLLSMPVVSSAQKLVPVAKAYSQTSVNTAVFRNNSLVTHKGWQYIAFYDADGFLTLGKRKQGKDKWQIERSQYRGKVQDAHNVISIMLDGNGYIHVSFDHHG